MPVNLALHIFRSAQFQRVVDEAIRFFTHTPVHELPPTDRFSGSGIYALYYAGDFELYAALADLNRDSSAQPIYVGKTVPAGWRTGKTAQSEGSTLFNRLKQHARNIAQASNLQVVQFRCRFMILRGIESDLIGAVEAELIRRFAPIWNTVVDGFGNHDPGAGRYNQAKSEWDVLHPGRPWADRLTGTAPSLERIVEEVLGHFT